MPGTLQLENYSPASEITVLAVCFVMVILLGVSFKVRMRSFRIFVATLIMLIAATSADLMLHYLIGVNPDIPRPIIYGLRSVYHILLFAMLHHYVAYTCEATFLSRKKRRPYIIAANALLAVFSLADTIAIFSGRGMFFIDGGIAFEGSQVFTTGYILFLLLILALLYRVRRRLYRQVMAGFFGVLVISMSMIIAARLRLQSTYTVSSFLFPLIAVMYMLHSNPYDAQLGTNDLRGLNNLIRYSVETGDEFLYMSLYMRELDDTGKTMSDEMRALIRHVAESYYRKSTLFQVSNGHILLMVPRKHNPNCDDRNKHVIAEFLKEYEHFRYDYKLVIGSSNRELNRRNEFISYLRSIHTRIPDNTIYQEQAEDLVKFRQYEAILKQLADIAANHDLDDPRVLAYCQPVYNIRTGKFDTAEALMRLKLDSVGFVYPNEFIPLAEQNGYIHPLTEIILNKACRVMHNLTLEGYDIDRISVNVSVMELRDEGFCGDIDRIIESSGVDAERIAIELTESRTDSDFLLMKDRIEELKQMGITFYLDDFGTGYSNMERILELPFDIIKFDRSMVLAGSQNERSEQVLGSLADLFSRLNYSVLYEGVENEQDEKMCRALSASYLQGYKYSRPVPIGELRKFLSKKV